MTNNADIRKAHRIVTNAGSVMTREQINLLRSMLPPLPKQKTLEEITTQVLDAWSCTSDNRWGGDGFDPDITMEDWLGELHAQLKGLKDAPVDSPAHPEFLETEADYEYAPQGTVVAVDGGMSPIVKDFAWPMHMSLVVRRRVLRWGLGA